MDSNVCSFHVVLADFWTHFGFQRSVWVAWMVLTDFWTHHMFRSSTWIGWIVLADFWTLCMFRRSAWVGWNVLADVWTHLCVSEVNVSWLNCSSWCLDSVCVPEVNVSWLKAISSLREVNLQDNPLTDEIHQQLVEINFISILLTPRDPELDGVDWLQCVETNSLTKSHSDQWWTFQCIYLQGIFPFCGVKLLPLLTSIFVLFGSHLLLGKPFGFMKLCFFHFKAVLDCYLLNTHSYPFQTDISQRILQNDRLCRIQRRKDNSSFFKANLKCKKTLADWHIANTKCDPNMDRKCKSIKAIIVTLK